MVLHTDLTVVERSEHSFDPFPDKGRVLPWGVGCSIAYNYVDFTFRNDIGRISKNLHNTHTIDFNHHLKSARIEEITHQYTGCIAK